MVGYSQQEAAEQAIEKVREVLKYPDDLNTKFESFRKKIISDKAAVDAQLKAATQTQLDDCQRGLENLFRVQDDLHKTKNGLEIIYNDGTKSSNMIPNFSRVQRVLDHLH
jgi:hypothetical protein